MHLSFKRAVKQPKVVDNVVNKFFPSLNAGRRFSKVFYNLFPDSFEHNPNMATFLEIFENFQYTTQPNSSERQAVDQLYQELGIFKTEDGVYQFWTYLIEIYQYIPLDPDRPNFDNLFAFMNEFPIHEIRAVIVGQDPSPNCESSGFAFHGSVCPTTRIVMDNINEEFRLMDTFCEDGNPLTLTKDELEEEKLKCSFMRWIKQGVLMINSMLTYKMKLWLKFTDFLIKYIGEHCPNTVFILAGGMADGKKELINKSQNLVVGVYHPNHPDQTLEQIRWDVQLPFLNTNFFLYQLSQERDNGKLMVDWVQNLDSDDHQNVRCLESITLYDTLLRIANQARELTSKYAGEVVHADYRVNRKILRLKRSPSGYFVVKYIDPYESLESFKTYVAKLQKKDDAKGIFHMRNNFGRTLLHEAVSRFDVDDETFLALVKLSEDINETDVNGNNMLMTANQENRCQGLIDLMVQMGAKPCSANDQRQNRLTGN